MGVWGLASGFSSSTSFAATALKLSRKPVGFSGGVAGVAAEGEEQDEEESEQAGEEAEEEVAAGDRGAAAGDAADSAEASLTPGVSVVMGAS